MAFVDIFLFLIVFQVITIVQACKFTKEAKDEIELGYHKINKYYDFSTLNLTFTNIPKSFDCEMENGTEIKLALNYKVNKKRVYKNYATGNLRTKYAPSIFLIFMFVAYFIIK